MHTTHARTALALPPQRLQLREALPRPHQLIHAVEHLGMAHQAGWQWVEGRRGPKSAAVGGSGGGCPAAAPGTPGALPAPHLLQALLVLARRKVWVPFQLERHSSGAEARHLGPSMAVEHSEDVAVVAEVLSYVRVLLQAGAVAATGRCGALGPVPLLQQRSGRCQTPMKPRSGPSAWQLAPPRRCRSARAPGSCASPAC